MVRKERYSKFKPFEVHMPFKPMTKVRKKNDPSKIGYTTGIVRSGAIPLCQVDFGTTKSYVAENFLEEIIEHANPEELFYQGDFGHPESLRMAVILEKLRGQITNMFYSMNVSAADFFAYQFKPVLKFIESVSGRILIADEVGLGKTIEASYIWKELEARKDARRLLIVCPAVLREKWKHDLFKLFGIRAVIWDTRMMLEEIKQVMVDPFSSFTGIVSIEAIRTRFSEESEVPAKSPTEKIAEIMLEQRDGDSNSKLFDLVIIDEAHNLRNANTASNWTATLIRDNTEHLVLLSATPVQTSDRNLFELLKLLAPEDYYDYHAYTNAVDDNRPILDAISAINSFQTTHDEIIEHSRALESLVDPALRGRMETAYAEGIPSPQERVDLSWRLSEYSYLNEYMNRTRKRDVNTRQVVREPHAVSFEFNAFEKSLYDSISADIREQILKADKGAPFILILRQKHMASCLPMGVQAYKRSLEKSLDDYESEEYRDESLYEGDEYDFVLPHLDIDSEMIQTLIANDSKYESVKRSLEKDVLSLDPKEKIIVFSFFRTTVMYLLERLTKDGFSVCAITGGMGEAKYEVIDNFASEGGPNILLSTEVGAEGLDLQFARVMINYDLPWNPMRVEQRIGRIDRIGQKSEKITIFNMVCENTIEDRVLQRLYMRIDIFKGTVGDLDEIIGSRVEKLMMNVIHDGLDAKQAFKKTDDEALAIANNRRNQETLEEQAINLLGFNDYIMQSIHDAKSRDRFISPSDLLSFVEDFFFKNYPGTKVKERYKNEDVLRLIQLSEDAKASLARFITNHPSSIRTRLSTHNNQVLCVFDPQYPKNWSKATRYESIEINHPLIQWILQEYDQDSQAVYRCAASTVLSKDCGMQPGQYVYAVQLWESSGSVDRKELRYFAQRIDDPDEMEEGQQEMLIQTALKYGLKWDEIHLDIDKGKANTCFNSLAETIADTFFTYMDQVRIDNDIRREKQRRYAKSMYDRKMDSAQMRLESLIENEKSESIIKATRGQIEKIKETYEAQLRRIGEIVFEPQFKDVAVGVIQVKV